MSGIFTSLALIASSALASDPVDFDTQIVSVLTRQGCNAGSCHGAAAGRGGFKLSLLGANAAADHDAIARQLQGRRVNLHDAELSLVLRKPSEQLGHEGGEALPEDSRGYKLVRKWIDQGAQRLQRRKLVKLMLSPSELRMERVGQSIPLTATATFDNGTSQDVTEWTVFKSDDPDAVEIDLEARSATVRRRGVHVVVARYLDRVEPIRLVVPLCDDPIDAGQMHSVNRVDEFVNAQLQQLNLPVSAIADDYAWARRVSLDLTGRLPTPDQLRQFADDQSPEKRMRLVDQLLAQESFSQYWSLKWANVLGIDSKQLQPEGAAAYHRWLAEQLDADAPMDQTAEQMLVTVGDSFVNGAANFSRTGSSPGDLAEHVTRVFMGIRLRCANCHDHPLDSWKQDDYHGLAAVFAKVKRGPCRHDLGSRRSDASGDRPTRHPADSGHTLPAHRPGWPRRVCRMAYRKRNSLPGPRHRQSFVATADGTRLGRAG